MSSRIPFVGGNWKMNKATAEAVSLAQAISNRYDDDFTGRVDIVLCPPAIDLKPVSNVLVFDKSPIMLGAQNVYPAQSGAYTGETSPGMLKEVGAKWCIVGHSERRQLFAETDEMVNAKAKALISAGLSPIICCGESEECKDEGRTNQFVSGQVRKAIAGIEACDVALSVIAYEPVWAIGTGRVPTPQSANEVCACIRKTVEECCGMDCAESVRIIYGGSMKAENAGLFIVEENIDGGLIGGASLDAASFMGIVEECV